MSVVYYGIMEKSLNHAGITAAVELFDEFIDGTETDDEMGALAAEIVHCVNKSKEGLLGKIAWEWSNWGGIEFVEAV